MRESDADYYTRRAEEEMQLALESDAVAVAAAHRDLAAAYAARLDQLAATPSA